MGLRSRIKETVKGLLGKEKPAGGATAPAGAMPSTAATPPATPKASPPPATPQASPPPPPRPPPPAPAPAPEPTDGAKTVDAEKIRKHQLKTKAGMLRWLGEQGGSSPMGPMHDHSERRFFVAHKAFSNLMEDLTEQGLVLYDSQTGMVTLTDDGRAWKA